MTRSRHTFRLPPELARRLADHSARKRVSRAAIVEAALVSFLSPDGSERMEAAFSRRLDRISRQLEKLNYHVEVGNEALAQFIRSWLVANPALPDSQLAAAQAQASERYGAFIQSLARRMDAGPRLAERLLALIGEFAASDDEAAD